MNCAGVDFSRGFRDVASPRQVGRDVGGRRDMGIYDYLCLGGALVALSAALTWFMIRVRILDVPNQRSSHQRPIPNSGGLSIVLTAYVGLSTVYLIQGDLQSFETRAAGLGLAAIMLVVVGLLDDMGLVRSFKSKLSAQFIACCVLLVFGIRIDELYLPFIGHQSLGLWAYPATLVWVLGLTNIYNFMDGLDGLAAGTAMLAAACFGLIALGSGAGFFYVTCFVLFSSTLGFFIFNFPRAKIFMGDVGSQFLGFVFAALAVLAASGSGGAMAYIVPLLFFHFLFDGIFTFFRRLLAGENVTQAHKGHLYQLLNQIGYSHARVSLLHFAMVLWQAAGAVAIARGAVSDPGLVLLPFVLVQSVYAALVVRAARRRGLV